MKDAHRVVIDLIADHPGCQIDVLDAMFPKEHYPSAHVPTIVDSLIEKRQVTVITVRMVARFGDTYRRYFFPYGASIIL